MKTFKLILAALVAFAMFSCKTNDPVEDNGLRKMSVKITNVQKGTRAEVAPVPDPYTTTLSSAYVFVVNAGGTVITRYQFTTTDLTNAEASFETTSAAAQVFIVGNYPAAFSPLSYHSSAELQAAVISMANLAPDASNVTADANYHGVKNAMLFNEAVASTTDESATEKSASLSLAPVMTRFEIGEVVGLTDDLGGTLDPLVSFDLKGIYMNRFYPSLVLTLPAMGPSGTFLIDETTAPIDNRPTEYPWSCDYFATAMTGALTYAPADGTGDPAGTYSRVWAYHLAPVSGTTNVPNVVARLDNVTLTTAGSVGEKYIVVTGYKDRVSGQAVENFKRNNVYRVETISFRSDKLRDNYYEEPIQLTVEVSVNPWVLNTIDPII